MSQIYDDDNLKQEELINEQNNLPKFTLKKAIFNRFYLEFIAYLLILFFSVVINAVILTSNLDSSVQMGISIFVSLVAMAFCFLLGFISAKRRDGIKKYIVPFGIFLIFGVVTIIHIICVMLGADNGIATFFMYATNIFIQSSQIIFSWLKQIIQIDVGYIGVVITVLMIFLGARKNVVKQRKERKQNDK